MQLLEDIFNHFFFNNCNTHFDTGTTAQTSLTTRNYRPTTSHEESEDIAAPSYPYGAQPALPAGTRVRDEQHPEAESIAGCGCCLQS
ncbi:MAG: hypothetical protein IPK76_24210 [Lewinellaceae bacterium]|nr:hypothetical protein [Lewinellaceae bacterium]